MPTTSNQLKVSNTPTKLTLNKITTLHPETSVSHLLPLLKDSKLNASSKLLNTFDNRGSSLVTQKRDFSKFAEDTKSSFNSSLRPLEDSVQKNVSKQLEGRLKELEGLKEKEFQYFKNNYVNFLDRKIEQLQADMEYEKNRASALKSLDTGKAASKVVGQNTDRSAKHIMTEIYYSKKQLETISARNNDLKAKLGEIKYKEQLIHRRPSKCKTNINASTLLPVKSQADVKAKRLEAMIEQVQSDIKKISEKAIADATQTIGVRVSMRRTMTPAK